MTPTSIGCKISVVFVDKNITSMFVRRTLWGCAAQWSMIITIVPCWVFILASTSLNHSLNRVANIQAELFSRKETGKCTCLKHLGELLIPTMKSFCFLYHACPQKDCETLHPFLWTRNVLLRQCQYWISTCAVVEPDLVTNENVTFLTF